MQEDTPTAATLERRLAELEREHETLLDALAHDLDAALRQARQFAQLLIRHAEADGHPELERRATPLRAALERAEGLAAGARALAHAAPVACAAEPGPVDCEPLVRRAFDECGAEGVSFAYDGPAPATATGHVGQLGALFGHLVGNAVRHRTADAPLAVQVRGRPHEGGWLFEVSDDGPGFPDGRRGDAFVLLRNIGSAERNVRVGLGLPASRAIVRRHAGDIRIVRAGSGGTTVAFTLGAALPAAMLDDA